jgi:hypothetical protein
MARASLDTTRPLADVVLDQVVPEDRCFAAVDTDAAWRQSLVLLAAEHTATQSTYWLQLCLNAPRS